MDDDIIFLILVVVFAPLFVLAYKFNATFVSVAWALGLFVAGAFGGYVLRVKADLSILGGLVYFILPWIGVCKVFKSNCENGFHGREGFAAVLGTDFKSRIPDNPFVGLESYADFSCWYSDGLFQVGVPVLVLSLAFGYKMWKTKRRSYY